MQAQEMEPSLPQIRLHDLPGIVGGTDRQVSYAYAIRRKYVNAFNTLIEIDFLSPPDRQLYVRDVDTAEAIVAEATEIMRTYPEARQAVWWIEGFAGSAEKAGMGWLADLAEKHAREARPSRSPHDRGA